MSIVCYEKVARMCHAERSEASDLAMLRRSPQMLRCAQYDTSEPLSTDGAIERNEPVRE